jgi:hypothetical protein
MMKIESWHIFIKFVYMWSIRRRVDTFVDYCSWFSFYGEYIYYIITFYTQYTRKVLLVNLFNYSLPLHLVKLL